MLEFKLSRLHNFKNKLSQNDISFIFLRNALIINGMENFIKNIFSQIFSYCMTKIIGVLY